MSEKIWVLDLTENGLATKMNDSYQMIKGSELGPKFHKHDIYSEEGLVVGWGSENSKGETMIHVRHLGGSRYLLDTQISRPVDPDELFIVTPPDSDRWKSSDAATWLDWQFEKLAVKEATK